MTAQKIVTRAQWIASRKELLVKEKEFTRLRDQLSKERRELPVVKVEKEYMFDTLSGKATLSKLFAEKSQLIVYHFMFHPNWEEGCPSCSFWADNFNGIMTHLNQRDVSLVAISKAPLSKLQAFKKRMGWSFTWVSSFENDFNRDYHVSFTSEELQTGAVNYNYGIMNFPVEEAPGISVFSKDGAGQIFHTYSCYSRGLDMLNTAYHYLDLAPKGRDESTLTYPMAWVKYHDKYDK